jgi:hypothetical protein
MKIYHILTHPTAKPWKAKGFGGLPSGRRWGFVNRHRTRFFGTKLGSSVTRFFSWALQKPRFLCASADKSR